MQILYIILEILVSFFSMIRYVVIEEHPTSDVCYIGGGHRTVCRLGRRARTILDLLDFGWHMKFDRSNHVFFGIVFNQFDM